MDRQDILSVLIGVVIVLVVALVVKPALSGGDAGGSDTSGAVPTLSPALTVPTPTPAPAVGDEIVREFRWAAIDGGVQTATLTVPSSLFDEERETRRISDSSAWGRYALSEDERPYLDDLLTQIASPHFNTPDEDYYRVMNVVFFVQQLPYISDDDPASYTGGVVPKSALKAADGIEYPKYPIETLVDGKGDCEDTSILAAALLNLMDYDVVLLSYSDHMAVGVQMANFNPYYADYTPKSYESGGKRYYYVETTNYYPLPNPNGDVESDDRWGRVFPVGDAKDSGIKSVETGKPEIIPLHFIVMPAQHTIYPALPLPGGER